MIGIRVSARFSPIALKGSLTRSGAQIELKAEGNPPDEILLTQLEDKNKKFSEKKLNGQK
ncbi:MAG: hypothetical protein HON76_10435 [Candidatus Scalindua sp.]|jgi:hypothetical protein|nr:hypothetical protein [Candidatus Scalindua sp.]MBT6228159.1 hypothetical protein [Candidatus Scalindua sp.]MBT6562930.1 hypothetical protein [Candidatus Scalindua sp.]MBT7590789.1 hypothetical protein [Candidatus Scalindua sp.]